MLRDKPLKGMCFDFFRPVERTMRPKGAVDAGVEDIEFGMFTDFPLGSFCKNGESDGKEKVFKDLDVSLHRFPFDFTLSRNVADVEHGGV